MQAQLDQAAITADAKQASILTPGRAGKRQPRTVREVFSEYRRAHGRWTKSLTARRLRRELQAIIKADRQRHPARLIVSDELFLGTAFGRDGTSIYPDHQRTLPALQDFLGSDPEEVHLTIRDYQSFLASTYAMRAIYSANIGPFENYRDGMVALTFGWPEVVETILTVFQRAPVHVWIFPVNLHQDKLLKQLLGEIPLPDDGGAEVLNASPTLPAINYALAHKTKAGFDPDQVMREFADGERFEPFSTQEKSRLAERFTRDCMALEELANQGRIQLHRD